MPDLQNPAHRSAYARAARAEAKREAEYARINHTMTARPIEVETQADRWRREVEAEERMQAEAKRERKAEADRKIREQRQHELALAHAWGKANDNGGVDWAELLGALNDTLDSLLERVDALEERVEAMANDGTEKRLDAIAHKSQVAGEEAGRLIATLEQKAEREHEAVRDLQTDIRILKSQVNAITNKPTLQLPEIRIVQERSY